MTDLERTIAFLKDHRQFWVRKNSIILHLHRLKVNPLTIPSIIEKLKKEIYIGSRFNRMFNEEEYRWYDMPPEEIAWRKDQLEWFDSL